MKQAIAGIVWQEVADDNRHSHPEDQSLHRVEVPYLTRRDAQPAKRIYPAFIPC